MFFKPSDVLSEGFFYALFCIKKMNNEIQIDGAIDRYGYSGKYLSYMLKQCSVGAVKMVISSYGGDVNEALKMCYSISEHGNIVIDYIGFNASASTILGLDANKTRISSDGFYLIHKPLAWVDEWGMMNPDTIDEIIQKLQTERKNLEVVTLVLAKKYSGKTGKSVSEILNLMKEERWLSADEAVRMGFVDEIFESKASKKTTCEIKNILQANGLPVPSCPEPTIDIASTVSKKVIYGIIEFFSNNNHKSKNQKMNASYTFVNDILNVQGFDEANGSVTLSLDQVTAINDAIKKLTSEKEFLTSEKQTLTDQVASITGSLNAIDQSVKDATDLTTKISAVRSLLNSRPATPASYESGKDSHTTSLDYVPDPVNNFFNE